MAICQWKSPRTERLWSDESNSSAYVRGVTGLALSTTDERLKIEVLTLLRGVNWPTASVLLHFGAIERYPILDFRALWSLGIDKPPAIYAFEFWSAYSRHCRELADEAGVTMRELDRALWQFSKENQRALSTTPAPARGEKARQIRAMYATGATKYQIAKQLQTPYSYVLTVCKRIDQERASR